VGSPATNAGEFIARLEAFSMLEKLPEGVGQALVNQRAGMDSILYNVLHRERDVARMELHSTAFAFNGRLPIRFTADGEGISPPLLWSNVPDDSDGLVLLVEDADSPTPHPLVHAIATGLERADDRLEEGALSSQPASGASAHDRIQIGPNSFFRHTWLAPDPPRGHGEHRYVFQLFALRGAPIFATGPGRSALIEAVLTHAVAVGCLIGTYERASEDAILAVPDGAVTS